MSKLDLSENEKLILLPEGLFKGLTCLREVNLRRNNISFFPEGIFEGLGNLIDDITNVAIPPNLRIEMDNDIERYND